MLAVHPVSSVSKSLVVVAWGTMVAGGIGMAISFAFLASAHYLDVVAGAAGFVAGSLLLTGSLIALSLLNAPPLLLGDRKVAPDRLADSFPSLAVERWREHFRRNREDRSEPQWHAPITLSADVIRPLVRSLEQFQLGDGGGPAYLVAIDRERLLASHPGTRSLIDLWFAEEREHARLLAGAVERFGGQPITGHWSFTAFCLIRRWMGVRFELTVLLLTEIVSTVYYRLLLRHGDDVALRAMCRLILRDERGHIDFHRDRLVRDTRRSYGPIWRLWFRFLGLAAATVLWMSHAPGLKAVGATRVEFYRDVQREISRFIRHLRAPKAVRMLP